MIQQLACSTRMRKAKLRNQPNLTIRRKKKLQKFRKLKMKKNPKQKKSSLRQLTDPKTIFLRKVRSKKMSKSLKMRKNLPLLIMM